MKPRKDQSQGPGRPTSGKKPFTLRTSPEAYEALCRAARDDGFEHLGDWLAQLPGLVVSGNQRVDPAKKLGKQLARRRFIVIASKVRALTEELHNVLDYDPRMVGDGPVFEAYSALKDSQHRLKRIFDDNSPWNLSG